MAAGAGRGDHSREVRGGSEGVRGVRGVWRVGNDEKGALVSLLDIAHGIPLTLWPLPR